ncbi:MULTISPECIES: YezD family protein [Lacrimispora]|uniref:YezD family protein n=1 Tax=Lacrimispora TaxID=2719231 RepID=UPI0004103577|nr:MULTISPECIES: YezD family protein [Lachnospiraceae]MDR2024882.1 YezD family protein [Hungatella sp.]
MIPISYSNAPDPEKEYIRLIHEMASHVKYGSITITIQDGKIVQIEKIEKIRLKD